MASGDRQKIKESAKSTIPDVFAKFQAARKARKAAKAAATHFSEDVSHAGILKELKKKLILDPEIKAKVDANQTNTTQFAQLAERISSELIKNDPELQTKFVRKLGRTPFGITLSEDERKQVINWMVSNPQAISGGDPSGVLASAKQTIPDIAAKYEEFKKKSDK